MKGSKLAPADITHYREVVSTISLFLLQMLHLLPRKNPGEVKEFLQHIRSMIYSETRRWVEGQGDLTQDEQKKLQEMFNDAKQRFNLN